MDLEFGGRVILIDPVRSESANFCDHHVQPRVATDAELAMAMAKVILEEGLDIGDMDTLIDCAGQLAFPSNRSLIHASMCWISS